MTDQQPHDAAAPSNPPHTAPPIEAEAPIVYPPGHHELMDPRDIASIEDWGPCG